MIESRDTFGIQWHDKREALVHMTRDGTPRMGFPGGYVPPSDAFGRLVNILRSGQILASYVNHMRYLREIPAAVAFSEALPETIQQMVGGGFYAPFGIMVHKQAAFDQGGGPVWYVDNEDFKSLTNDPSVDQQTIEPRLRFLLSPYAPVWSTRRSHRNTPMDWTQEREWRIPHDFALPNSGTRSDYFVIVPDGYYAQRILDLSIAGIAPADLVTIDQIPEIY